MTLIPFFIDLSFDKDGTDERPVCPTDPVGSVSLGYFNGRELVKYSYEADDKGWADVADWIRSLSRNGFIAPVGWELRSLVWPALTMNLARRRQRLPAGFMMPVEKRWNNMDMVDLSILVMQSGPTEWRPRLKDVHKFFMFGEDQNKSRLEMVYDLFKIYSEMNGG